MKNTCLLVIMLVISSSLFVGCTGGDEDLNDKPIFPIQLGNFWKYKLTYHNEDRYGVPDYDTLTQRVVGPITINGVDYLSMDAEYNHEEYYNGEDAHERFLYGCDENGNLVTYGGISNVDSLIVTQGVIMFKKKVHVGEVFEASFFYLEYGNNDERFFKEEKETQICISTDTLISTPAGKFHCIAFDSEFDGESYSRSFFSVNVGLVRQEQFDYGKLFGETELFDFKVR